MPLSKAPFRFIFGKSPPDLGHILDISYISCISYIQHISCIPQSKFHAYLRYIYISKIKYKSQRILGISQEHIRHSIQKYIVSIRGQMNRNNSASFEYVFETGISGKKRIIRIKLVISVYTELFG